MFEYNVPMKPITMMQNAFDFPHSRGSASIIPAAADILMYRAQEDNWQSRRKDGTGI